MNDFKDIVSDFLGLNSSVDVSIRILRDEGIDPDEFGKECEAANKNPHGAFFFEKVEVNPNDPEEFKIRITKRR